MFVIFIIIPLTAAYFLLKHHYTKWQRLGIPYEEPAIPYGSLIKVSRKEKAFGVVIADIYEKYKDKIVGIYLFFKPTILIRDADVVRQIMTKDFNSFHDRGLYIDEKHDPMSANLFTLEGQKWRALRTKLTPSFSSGKLKEMFEITDNVADKLVKYLNELLKNGESQMIEMKAITTTYSVDIIGAVIFGLDIDSFSNPDNEFRQLSDRLFMTEGVLQRIRRIMTFVCPPIAVLLTRLGILDHITYSLKYIVQKTIEFREKTGVTRKDLLQLMIKLRNADKKENDNVKSLKNEATAENLKSMSIDVIASNAFLFYIAGSETTAATIALTLYEFAMYPEILKKAQNEVDQCLHKHGLKQDGTFSYDAIQDMKYLDLCVKESMRKYPGLPVLNRECTQDYLVPGTSFTIKKGTGIVISLMGIHRDPEYFPNPMDYKPERFLEEIMDYNPVAFMPFGEGPRHCIAQRMGVLNVKVALAKILANFNIESMKRKEVEFKFHAAPVLVPVNGLTIGLSKRW